MTTKKPKGWIALDIDGTITLSRYSVPPEVTSFLKELYREGWVIALATGRPFAFAWMAVENFDFPFYLLAQNGSIALSMPEKKTLFKRYIPAESLRYFEEAYEGMESDFLIYSGYERGDFCYYRPKRFSPKELDYIEELQQRQAEKWRPVEAFIPEEIGSSPLVKCFGPTAFLAKIKERLDRFSLFEIAHIRDLHAPGTDVLLVTDRLASKGLSLATLIDYQGRGEGGQIIVAGDDENDLSLFDVADVRIAMPHAPASLLERADWIAPPAKELGIIKVLKMVLRDGDRD